MASQKGMDPADPYFENTEPLIRLDPTDGNITLHSLLDGISLSK